MLDTSFSNPALPRLMTGEELASAMRYTGVTSAFRASLKHLGIRPVPGRQDIYDPRHVRHQLDVAQGMLPQASVVPGVLPNPMSKTAERRLRRGK